MIQCPELFCFEGQYRVHCILKEGHEGGHLSKMGFGSMVHKFMISNGQNTDLLDILPLVCDSSKRVEFSKEKRWLIYHYPQNDQQHIIYEGEDAVEARKTYDILVRNGPPRLKISLYYGDECHSSFNL